MLYKADEVVQVGEPFAIIETEEEVIEEEKETTDQNTKLKKLKKSNY